MTIKLVAFDLDDCLFDSTGLSERARIKGIEAMFDLGLKMSKKKAIKIIYEIVEEYGSNFSKHYDYFVRRIDHNEKNVNLSFNTQCKLIAAAIMAYHKEKIESIKLYDDVQDCLKLLRKRGIKTAIITDGIPIKQYEKILRLEIDKLIDLVIISDEIGIRKPNPALFRYCLNKLDIKGSETIYIGDRIDKDIIPANKNDIHTVYVHRGGKYDSRNTGIKILPEEQPDFEIESFVEIEKIITLINE